MRLQMTCRGGERFESRVLLGGTLRSSGSGGILMSDIQRRILHMTGSILLEALREDDSRLILSSRQEIYLNLKMREVCLKIE